MKRGSVIIICMIVFLGYACHTSKSKKSANDDLSMVEKKTISQQQALDQRKTNFNKSADQKTKDIYKDGLEAVRGSNVIESAKKVGDHAPDFKLQNAVGKEVSLSDFLKKGPVVLVWYRGGWCPYCNINLNYLQEELPNIKAQGANLLALSPELPDEALSTSEKHHLQFEVLSDVGNKVAKEYGVVYKLTEGVAAIYNKKFDLNNHNGDNSNELPLAATYIINTDGKIVYAFLDADYRKRAEPSDITAFLKKMKF